MVEVVPLDTVPSQVVTVVLGGQRCRIEVYSRFDWDGPVSVPALYLNLYVADQPVISGVICRNAVRIVRDAYLGFQGDLAFFDSQGADDPQYGGLAGRWFLAYLPVGS